MISRGTSCYAVTSVKNKSGAGISKTTIPSFPFLYPFLLHLFLFSLWPSMTPILLQATFPPSLSFYFSPFAFPSLHSPCMCPFIPPVFEGQVLTASWHVVRPTMQDCAVALCLRGQERPRQVHYITPINTDWAQDGSPCMLMSGWPGPAHMPLIQEQMWSTDPERSLPLFPPSALHTASSQPCCPGPCLVGR